MNILKKLFGIKDKKKDIAIKKTLPVYPVTYSPTFKQYLKMDLFNKIISILVTACFVISIVNLPAFADTEDIIKRKDKKEITEQTTNESVYNSGSTSASKSSSVYRTQNIKEKNNGVLETEDGKQGSILIQNGDITVTSPNNSTHTFLPDKSLKETVIGKALEIAQKKQEGKTDNSLKEETVNVALEIVDKVKKELIDYKKAGGKDGEEDITGIAKRTGLSEETVEVVIGIFNRVREGIAAYEKTNKKENKATYISNETGRQGHFLSEDAVNGVLNITNDIDNQSKENKEVLTNQDQTDQANVSITETSTDVLGSVLGETIIKVPGLDLATQAATSIVKTSEENNNNGQDQQMASDQEQNDALNNIANEALNKEEVTNVIEEVTEKEEITSVEPQQEQPQSVQQQGQQQEQQQGTGKVLLIAPRPVEENTAQEEQVNKTEGEQVTENQVLENTNEQQVQQPEPVQQQNNDNSLANNSTDNQQTLTEEEQAALKKEQELSEKIKKDFGEDANKIFDMLSEQTGLDKEQIYNILKESGEEEGGELSEKKINASISALANTLGISEEEVEKELENIISKTYTQNDKVVEGSNESNSLTVNLSVSMATSITGQEENQNSVTETEQEKKQIPATKKAIDDRFGKGAYELMKKLSEATNVPVEKICEIFIAENVTKKNFQDALPILWNKLVDNLAEIVNCAANALGTAVSAITDLGLATIQMLAVDMSGDNAFLANNGSDSKANQINFSWDAMQQVADEYGAKMEGVEFNSVDEVIDGMDPGDKVIMNVNDSHNINIEANKDGTFSVTDINKNSGKPITYTKEELKKLLNNQEATGTTADGKKITTKGYKAVSSKNGKVNVLTESKNLAKKGRILNRDELKKISGADHWETYTYTVTETRTRVVTGINWVKTALGISIPVPYVRIEKYTVKVKKQGKRLVRDNKDDAAKKKAEEARKKAEEAKRKAEEARKKAEEAKKKAEEARKEANKNKNDLVAQMKAKLLEEQAKKLKAEAEKAKKAADSARQEERRTKEKYNEAKKEANRYKTEKEKLKDIKRDIKDGLANNEDYKKFISSEEGRKWLGSDEGQKFMQTDAGQKFMESEVGQKWLQTDAGQKFMQSDAGQKFMQSDAGQQFMQSDAGQKWLKSDVGTQWLNSDLGKKWLNSDAGKEFLEKNTDTAKDIVNNCFGGDFKKFASIFADENGVIATDNFKFLMNVAGKISGTNPQDIANIKDLPENGGAAETSALSFMVTNYDSWYSLQRFNGKNGTVDLNDNNNCTGVNINTGTLALTEQGKNKITESYFGDYDAGFNGVNGNTANDYASLVNALGGYENFSGMLLEQVKNPNNNFYIGEGAKPVTQTDVLNSLVSLTGKIQDTGNARYQDSAAKYNCQYQAMTDTVKTIGEQNCNVAPNGIEITNENISQDILDKLGLQSGTYHSVIVFDVQKGEDGKYSATEYKGVTTPGGCDVQSNSVGSYKVFGVETKYEGMPMVSDCIYQKFTGKDENGKLKELTNPNSWESYTSTYNLYFTREEDKITQQLNNGGGSGSGGESGPNSMTNARININGSSAVASGVGGRVTIDRENENALVVAKGSYAKAGSKITNSSPKGKKLTIAVTEGATYDGENWNGGGVYIATDKEVQDYFNDVAKSITGQDCSFGDKDGKALNLSDINFSGQVNGKFFDVGSFCNSVNEQNNGYSVDKNNGVEQAKYGFIVKNDNKENGSTYDSISSITCDVFLTSERNDSKEYEGGLTYYALGDSDYNMNNYHGETANGDRVEIKGQIHKGDKISATEMLKKSGSETLVNDVKVTVAGKTFEPGEFKMKLVRAGETLPDPEKEGETLKDEKGNDVKLKSDSLVLGEDFVLDSYKTGNVTHKIYWAKDSTVVHLSNDGTSGYLTGTLYIGSMNIAKPKDNGQENNESEQNDNKNVSVFNGKIEKVYDNGNLLVTGYFTNVDSRNLQIYGEGGNVDVNKIRSGKGLSSLYGTICTNANLEEGSYMPNGEKSETAMKIENGEWKRKDAQWFNVDGSVNWGGVGKSIEVFGKERVYGALEWVNYGAHKLVSWVTGGAVGPSDAEFRAWENNINAHLHGTNGFEGKNVQVNEDGTIKSMDLNENQQHIINQEMEKISIAAAVAVVIVVTAIVLPFALPAIAGLLGAGSAGIVTTIAASAAEIGVLSATFTGGMALWMGEGFANSYMAWHDADLLVQKSERENNGEADKSLIEARDAAFKSLVVDTAFVALSMVPGGMLAGLTGRVSNVGSKLLARTIGRTAVDVTVKEVGESSAKIAINGLKGESSVLRNTLKEGLKKGEKIIIKNNGEVLLNGEKAAEITFKSSDDLMKGIEEVVIENADEGINVITKQGGKTLSETLLQQGGSVFIKGNELFVRQGFENIVKGTINNFKSMSRGELWSYFGTNFGTTVIGGTMGFGSNVLSQAWNGQTFDFSNIDFVEAGFAGFKGAVLGFALKGSYGTIRNAGLRQSGSLIVTQGFSALMLNRSLDSLRYNLEEGNYGAALFDMAMVIIFVKVARKSTKDFETKAEENAKAKEANKNSEAEGAETGDINSAEQANQNTRDLTRAKVQNNEAYESFLKDFKLEKGMASKALFYVRNAQKIAFVTTALFAGQRIAGNISEGKNPVEGITFHEVATMYVLGFALGGVLTIAAPGFAGVWGENIESITSDISLFAGEESLAASAVSLSKFTALFDPMMSAISKVYGAIKTGNLSEIDFNKDIFDDMKEKYINTFWTDFETLYGTRKENFEDGEIFKAQQAGDTERIEQLQGWQSVKSSFATGIIMSPIFRMAMPGHAMFAGRTNRLSKLLNRGTSSVAENGNVFVAGAKWLSSGLGKVLGKEIGGEAFGKLTGNIIFSNVNMALTIKQFEIVGEVAGWVGKIIDDAIDTPKTYTNQKGEQCGIFEFFLENASMLFVPTGINAKTMKKYAIEDISKLDSAKAKYEEAKKEINNREYETKEEYDKAVENVRDNYNKEVKKIAPRILENRYNLNPMEEASFVSEQQKKVLSDIMEVNNVNLVDTILKSETEVSKLTGTDLLQKMLENSGIKSIDFGKDLNPLLYNSVIEVTVDKIKEYESNVKNVEDHLNDYHISKNEETKEILMQKLGLNESGFNRLVEIDAEINRVESNQILKTSQKEKLSKLSNEKQTILEGKNKLNSRIKTLEENRNNLTDRYGLGVFGGAVRDRKIKEKVLEEVKQIKIIEQEIRELKIEKENSQKGFEEQYDKYIKDRESKIEELQKTEEDLKSLDTLNYLKDIAKYFSQDNLPIEKYLDKIYDSGKEIEKEIKDVEENIKIELRKAGLTEQEIEYNIGQLKEDCENIKTINTEIKKLEEIKNEKEKSLQNSQFIEADTIDIEGKIKELEQQRESAISEATESLQKDTLDRIMDKFSDELKGDIINEFFVRGDEKNAFKYASERQKTQFKQAQEASAEDIKTARDTEKELEKKWNELDKNIQNSSKYKGSFELYKLDMVTNSKEYESIKSTVKHEIIRSLDKTNEGYANFLNGLSEQAPTFEQIKEDRDKDIKENKYKSDTDTRQWKEKHGKELENICDIDGIKVDFYSYQTIKLSLAQDGCYGYGAKGLGITTYRSVYEKMFGKETGDKLYKQAQNKYSADQENLKNLTMGQLEALFDASLWVAVSSSLEGEFLFSRVQYMGIRFIFESLAKPAFEMPAGEKISKDRAKEIAENFTREMKKLEKEFMAEESLSDVDKELLENLFGNEDFTNETKLIESIMSGNILKKINVFGTGAGKTAIISTLFPALKLINDMNGQFTIISVDVDTNILNLMGRINGYFGSSYDVLKADKDNIDGISPEKALFMTYTDFGFAMLEGENTKSPIKGKVGIMLCDEADMIVYVSKVMMSDSGGFEKQGSNFFDWFMGCVEKDGKYAKVYNETKTALEEYFSNAEKGESANGDSTYNELLTQRNALRNFVEKEGKKPDLSTVEKSLKELSEVPELKTKMSDLDKAELLLDMTQNLLNSRAKELLKNGKIVNGKSEFDQIIEEKFIREIKDINKNDVFDSQYTLEEIAHNMFEADLTWVEGVDYGVGKDAEGNRKVMLISGGALADLVPAAGFKQIIEARKLSEGEDIAGITAIGNQKQVSTAIIDAVGDARGMMGLTGTFKEKTDNSTSAAGEAFAKIGVSGNYFTEPTEIKNLTHNKDGYKNTKFAKGKDANGKDVDLDIKWDSPVANMLEIFNKNIETMLEGDRDTLIIEGMSQSEITLFKKYGDMLGLWNVETSYIDKETGENVKLGDRVAWFDAKMGKADGDKMAKNKDGRYLFYIGTPEQLGRGVDIQAPEDAKKVQLNVINPHLSYKSAIEQLIGRIGGTRFAAIFDGGKGKNNIEINIMSDIETIKANAGDIETNMISGDISKIDTANFKKADYYKLVVDRVYGDDLSGRIAEDRIVMQSGATMSKDIERARRDDFLREKRNNGEESPTVKEVRELAKNGGYGFTYNDPIIQEILEDAKDDEQLTNYQWFAIENYGWLLGLTSNYDDNEKKKIIRENKQEILNIITTGNVAGIYNFVATTNNNDINKDMAKAIENYEQKYEKMQDRMTSMTDEQRYALRKFERFAGRFEDKNKGEMVIEGIKSLKELPGGIIGFMQDPITNVKLASFVFYDLNKDKKDVQKAQETLNNIKKEAFNQYIVSGNKNIKALEITATLNINDGYVSFADDETIETFEELFGQETEETKNLSGWKNFDYNAFIKNYNYAKESGMFDLFKGNLLKTLQQAGLEGSELYKKVSTDGIKKSTVEEVKATVRESEKFAEDTNVEQVIKDVFGKEESELTTEQQILLGQAIDLINYDNVEDTIDTFAKVVGVNVSELKNSENKYDLAKVVNMLQVLQSEEILTSGIKGETIDNVYDLSKLIEAKDGEVTKATLKQAVANYKTNGINENLLDSSISKAAKQVTENQNQENFDKVKEQVAQKYEAEGNTELAETVRDLTVEDGKVVFKTNIEQAQDATVNKIIEEIKKIDDSKKGNEYNAAFKEVVNEYSSKDLEKALEEISKILFEKYGIKENQKNIVTMALFGVTEPAKYSQMVAKLLASTKNANEIANMIGFDNLAEIKGVTKKEITNRAMQTIRAISDLDISNEDKVEAIAMVAPVIDILVAYKDNLITEAQLNNKELKPSEIEVILANVIKSKAVNMNVVVNGVSKVKDLESEEFIIDVVSLQQAVKDKEAVEKAKKELKNKDWGAILNDFGRGSQDLPVAFMKLSDIKAVAASA